MLVGGVVPLSLERLGCCEPFSDILRVLIKERCSGKVKSQFINVHRAIISSAAEVVAAVPPALFPAW